MLKSLQNTRPTSTTHRTFCAASTKPASLRSPRSIRLSPITNPSGSAGRIEPPPLPGIPCLSPKGAFNEPKNRHGRASNCGSPISRIARRGLSGRLRDPALPRGRLAGLDRVRPSP
ncbi:MAG: hypothetical protein B7Y02_09295, partial [Rhodobacterales bacterium 17-64-5]